MIRLNFIYLVLNFFDFFQQKKIFNFLKKRIPSNSILFDVGAHHGETILNFKKNFSFNQIHSFEASKVNFEMLKRAGFKDIITVFQWLCFKGFLCIK